MDPRRNRGQRRPSVTPDDRPERNDRAERERETRRTRLDEVTPDRHDPRRSADSVNRTQGPQPTSRHEAAVQNENYEIASSTQTEERRRLENQPLAYRPLPDDTHHLDDDDKADVAAPLARATSRPRHGVPPRRQRQEDNEPEIASGLLRKFMNFPVQQYESCATFCRSNPEIWRVDLTALERFAKWHLRRNDDVSREQGGRAIQRYLMLSNGWKPVIRGARTKQDILNYLGVEEVQQSLDDCCRQYMSSWSPSEEVDARSGRTQAGAPSMADLDSDILAAGGNYRFAYLGPRTEIIERLQDQNQERQQVYDGFMKHYKLHIGRKNIAIVFGVGSVIAIFWHENHGESLPERIRQKNGISADNKPRPGKLGPGYISYAQNGSIVYSHIRRFIIVSHRQGFSVGIPITSYSGTGLTKYTNFAAAEIQAHTMVYPNGGAPGHLPDEPTLTKQPICVDIKAPGETLNQASRLFYAKPYTIEHNIKVKYIGNVIPKDRRVLLHDYMSEIASPTS